MVTLPSLADAARAIRNGPYVPFLALLLAVAALGAVEAVLAGSRQATVEVMVGPPPAAAHAAHAAR